MAHGFWVVSGAAALATAGGASAAPRKVHSVVLGAARKVPYSKAGDPAGAAAGEDELKIRALLVDGVLKEWTTGDAHDVTDRSFVVRRVIRLNDALPGDKPGPGDKQSHWVWQRGPWLLVDRVTGHVTALKLPDYDPGVSQVSWFRDYAAYCGVTASGKSLYAVVAQVAARKPVLAKKLAAFDPESHPRTGLRPAGVAARAAAHHLSSHGQGCGELRHRSRLGGAGGRRGRRGEDTGSGPREVGG
jgi:hypothetical protein